MSGQKAMNQQQRYVEKSGRSHTTRRQVSRRALRLAVCMIGLGAMMSLTGCGETYEPVPKMIGDYFNLRNSFIDPSQVGRFSKDNPWGKVKPVKWPILDQLDIGDETVDYWANATDPTPADLVPEVKEYVLAPGDTISISIWEFMTPGADFTQQRPVNELGYVSLQNLGPILVTGLTPSQVESKISQMLVEKKILPGAGGDNLGPQVNVQIVESRQHIFTVLGNGHSGTFNVQAHDFRLLDAVPFIADLTVQPGTEYFYVIRQIPYAEKPNEAGNPTTGGTSAPAAIPAVPVENPLDTLEKIENGAPKAPTQPAPGGPATGPQSESKLPEYLAPLPTAVVVSSGPSIGRRRCGRSAGCGLG